MIRVGGLWGRLGRWMESIRIGMPRRLAVFGFGRRSRRGGGAEVGKGVGEGWRGRDGWTGGWPAMAGGGLGNFFQVRVAVLVTPECDVGVGGPSSRMYG